MARKLNRLTVRQVETAKPRDDGKGRLIADGGNLWLQITRSADGSINKSWVFRYVSRVTKKERAMGLGSTQSVGVSAARELAADARLLLARGRPPRRKNEPAGPYGGRDCQGQRP